MKITIEIDAEIDGEWQAGDKELLENAVLANPHYGGWTIEEGRLNVMNDKMSIEIKG